MLNVNDVQEKDGVQIFKPVGRIDSTTNMVFEIVLNELVAKGKYRIEVDLSEIEFMGSAGLRTLLSIHKQVIRTGRHGRLTLKNLPPNVLKPFQLAGIDEVLNIE